MGGPRRSAFFLQGENLGALLGGAREPLTAPLGNGGPPSPWRSGRLSCQLWGPRQPAAGSRQPRGSCIIGRRRRHMGRAASSARAPQHPGRNPEVL